MTELRWRPATRPVFCSVYALTHQHPRTLGLAAVAACLPLHANYALPNTSTFPQMGATFVNLMWSSEPYTTDQHLFANLATARTFTGLLADRPPSLAAGTNHHLQVLYHAPCP